MKNILKVDVEKYLINNPNKIKINSKNINIGDVFIALQGNKTHGNEYIDKAQINGVKYIITDKKLPRNKNINLLEVNEIYDFLFNIASKKRNQFKGKIIAITGSVGKTSIKELIKYFLISETNVSASIKSYNNYLGVLISIINMDLNSQFAIFEVGTNNFNEIKFLSSLILPHQVIITNIYPTHLKNFQNTRNIAIEKSDLFNPKYNPNVELVILPNSNDDELYLNNLAKKYKTPQIITFCNNESADYSIKEIKIKNNFLSKVTLKSFSKDIQLETSTSFRHQIMNILVSLAIYEHNQLLIDNFLNKTKKIPLLEGRGLISKIKINNKDVTLIDESYNASPYTMKNCMYYFEKYKNEKNQRKILIIGEMLELGELSMKFHREIFSIAMNLTIDKIIFCGNLYKKILNQSKYNSNKFYYFTDMIEILFFLNNIILKNDIILAKGSNSSNVNKLVKKILETQRKK